MVQKNRKKLGTHLRVLGASYPMNTNTTLYCIVYLLTTLKGAKVRYKNINQVLNSNTKYKGVQKSSALIIK